MSGGSGLVYFHQKFIYYNNNNSEHIIIIDSSRNRHVIDMYSMSNDHAPAPAKTSY
jgi:hypothetical protein